MRTESYIKTYSVNQKTLLMCNISL